MPARSLCSPAGTEQTVARHGSAGEWGKISRGPSGTAHQDGDAMPCFFSNDSNSHAESIALGIVPSRWDSEHKPHRHPALPCRATDSIVPSALECALIKALGETVVNRARRTAGNFRWFAVLLLPPPHLAARRSCVRPRSQMPARCACRGAEWAPSTANPSL
jgi:hypothetical protein